MEIGILQAGQAPEELIDIYGSYAEMFIALLDPKKQSFDFKIFDIYDNEFPLSCDECDGWIITGSRHGVYESISWIEPLSQLIVDIVNSNRPLLGICFGHQIIAQALGGKVEKSAKGWGAGFGTYKLTDKAYYMDNLNSEIMLNMMHQDQVTMPPSGAVVYAVSDFCQCAGFYIDDKVLTMQAHPEFLVDFNKALLIQRSSTVIPKEIVDPALVELDGGYKDVDSDNFAQSMRNFLLR